MQLKRFNRYESAFKFYFGEDYDGQFLKLDERIKLAKKAKLPADIKDIILRELYKKKNMQVMLKKICYVLGVVYAIFLVIYPVIVIEATIITIPALWFILSLFFAFLDYINQKA